jgi:hypothetical protein
MKYAIEIGSDVITYIPSFIQTDSGIQRLIRGDLHIHRQHGGLTNLLLIFQNKKVKKVKLSLCLIN